MPFPVCHLTYSIAVPNDATPRASFQTHSFFSANKAHSSVFNTIYTGTNEPTIVLKQHAHPASINLVCCPCLEAAVWLRKLQYRMGLVTTGNLSTFLNARHSMELPAGGRCICIGGIPAGAAVIDPSYVGSIDSHIALVGHRGFWLCVPLYHFFSHYLRWYHYIALSDDARAFLYVSFSKHSKPSSLASPYPEGICRVSIFTWKRNALFWSRYRCFFHY
mmetsp:Transcript_4000/g.6692  ORF Transcript_4000/g.6692 Transcript_4000/m.6692 type:complete len:219 (-) Transcript_4000:71-727(-)